MNPEAKRPDTQTRGVTKQSKTHNLLKCMRDREEDILRFMTEPLAEFTNNQAERNLRMNKMRVKVSKGVRELEPAQQFIHIHLLVSTATKQAVCQLQTLESVFTQGNSDYMRLIRPD
jgi:transposase